MRDENNAWAVALSAVCTGRMMDLPVIDLKELGVRNSNSFLMLRKNRFFLFLVHAGNLAICA